MTKFLSASLLFISIQAFCFQKVLFLPFGETRLDVSWVNSPIKNVSCGKFHAYFQTESNMVFGVSDPKALGIQIPRIELKMDKVSTGDIHSLFLSEENRLLQFFSVPILDMYYPKNLIGIREMGSASKMSYALSNKNILFTWGAGNVISSNAIYPKTYGVKTASLGENHVAFINIKDRVFVWGNGDLGQKQIPSFLDSPEDIVSGENHILVKDRSGNLYAWGDNKYGQISIPDSIKGGVTKIYAKGDLSAALIGDSILYVWGKNVNQRFELKELGKIKILGLGNDYLILVVDQAVENLSLFSDFEKKIPKADFKKNDEARESASSFLESIAKSDFGKNDFTVRSTNSEWNGDFGTEVTFEGSGNTITIKNSGMVFNLDGSTQKIIFKGSNNNIVINQSNKVVNASGKSEIIVVDLNALNNNPEYSEYYSQESEKLTDNSGSKTTWTPDANQNNDPNQFYDPIGNIGYFDLQNYPIYDNYYFIYSTGIDLPVSDYGKLQNEISQMSDSYEIAQVYSYLGQNAEAVNELVEGVNSDYQICESCYSQLYYIYKDGLLGQPVNTEKANYILSLYCKNFGCYSYKFEEGLKEDVLFLDER